MNKRFHRLSGIFFTAALSVFASASIGGALDSLKNKLVGKPVYEIKDSGYLTTGGSRFAETVYWLDNEQIIFLGRKKVEVRPNGKQPNRLLIWNTTTGEVLERAELSSHSYLCARGRQVLYTFERDGTKYVKFGEIWQERETEMDIQAQRDGILETSPISCRQYNPKLLRKRYGNNALPLRKPGEYLDRTAGNIGETMRYFPEDGSDPISLTAIPNRDVLTIPRYSAYLDKYVFEAVNYREGQKFNQRVWLLDREGKVEQLTIPAGPWMGSPYVMPAKGGVAFSSRALTRGSGNGAAGLYFVQGSDIRRLIEGLPASFDVSPDGCKVAIAIETDWPGPVRLMMINVCTGGK